MDITKIRNIRFNWRKPKKIRTYSNCSNIPTYNFFEIQNTGDFSWLVVGYDGFDLVKIPDNAPDIFNEIVNEYAKLTGNNKTAQYYELIVQVAELDVRYKTVKALLKCMATPTRKKTFDGIVEELLGWKFHFNKEKPFDSEYKRMQAQLRSAKTKHDIKKLQLEELISKDEGVDILKAKVTLERILNRPYIDLKRIVLKEWIYINKDAEEVSRANRKAAKK